MASFKCKATFHNYRWKRKGYAQTMNSSGVQSMLERKAANIESECNSTFTPSKGESAGYTKKQWKGSLAKGYAVGTNTHHANASERKHNRLVNAIGSE